MFHHLKDAGPILGSIPVTRFHDIYQPTLDEAPVPVPGVNVGHVAVFVGLEGLLPRATLVKGHQSRQQRVQGLPERKNVGRLVDWSVPT